MKNFKMIAGAICLLLATGSYAEGMAHDHAEHMKSHEGMSLEKQVADAKGASCADKIDVSVNGLVCDFCARALEKVFGDRDDVAGIDVDLNEGKVTIATEPGANIDDATVTQLITDSGYNVVGIQKGCS